MENSMNGSIVESLENKTILITGSTGFLAKVFVEKLLRVQPNVRHLFLLLRATDPRSAAQRLHTEVTGKEVFRVLRTKHGNEFNSFLSQKVTAIAGDITLENFGLREDSVLLEKLFKEVDIVANFAASTKFTERYDVALEVNTIGAKNFLDFAKKCVKLEMLIHVSTAYVCGEQSGVISERQLKMGETLNQTSEALDIEAEMKLMQNCLKGLTANQVSKTEEKEVMENLGIQRARAFGWPNTYVFTKAMGEMLIGKYGGNVPIVIIRPTIITSTYKEPFPGWSEGVRTIDSFVVAGGKGKLPCFLGNTETILDVVPGDMVVNAVIVAMVAHTNHQSSDPFIYQVCSSQTDSLRSIRLRDYGYNYFIKNPLIGKDGQPIKVTMPVCFATMDSFRSHIYVNYALPLKVLEFVNFAFCQYFHDTCKEMNRKINQTMRLVEINLPYIFFKGTFDDLNTERLRMAVRTNTTEASTFYFDPKCIDWDDYFTNIHIPGLVKYVIKQ
ncbi:hypothetical protein MKX01_032289 [Papaver californicum]|nr:hypothetical protein MKX01_032289 [Papaver californicum]